MIRAIGIFLASVVLTTAIPGYSLADEPVWADQQAEREHVFQARRISVGGQPYLVEMRQTKAFSDITIESSKGVTHVSNAVVFGTEVAVSREGRQFGSGIEDLREAEGVADAYCAHLLLARAKSSARAKPRFVSYAAPQNNEWIFGGLCPWRSVGQP